MGAMKTHIRHLVICLMMFSQAAPAFALGNGSAALHQFAVCAGRFSALMEHQWLVDGPASEQTALHRAAMLSLVEAVQGDGDAKQAMHWRITAKVAQAGLLSRAHFAQDAVAARQSDALLQGCRDLIGQS
jgi:hypothetical protein